MKDRDSNLGDPAISIIWVDSNWNGITDLTDQIGGRAKVKTLFFGKGVKVLKKNANEVYTLTIIQWKEEWVCVKIRYYQIKPLILHTVVYSNVFEEKNYNWLKLSGVIHDKYEKL